MVQARLIFGLLLVLTCCVPSQAHAQFAAETPERVYTEAFKLYSDQLYVQAIDAFDDFRTRYPHHISTPEALYYQAESALIVGREEQAIALFTTFEDQYPSHPLAYDARLALGTYYYSKGNYDRAITTLARVIQQAPPDEVASKALYWMGESATHLNNVPEAIRYYERAALEYPETTTAPTALYAIATLQIEQGEPDAAARFFELLTARYPNSTYTQGLGLALAEVYYEQGEYQRAIDEVNRRMPNLDSYSQDRAHFLLAESYNQMRNSDLAIVHYRRFTESSPDSPYYRNALYGLAWNYHFQGAFQWAADNFGLAKQGSRDVLASKSAYYQAVNTKLARNLPEAMNLFHEAADQFPRSPMADTVLFELGMTAYELHNWEVSRDAFSRLLNDYPNSSLRGEAFYRRGSAMIALGDFDAALSNFDRAIALNAAPADLKNEVLFQKAWLQYRYENYREAAPAFMSLHDSAPTSEWGSDALFWAAESYHQSGDLNRAASLFRQYLRGNTGGKHVDAAHYALGWTYFKQANYQDAITEFRTFLREYRESDGYVPYRTDAQLRLADSYYALKRYPEAIQAYQQVGGQDSDDYALYQIGQAYNNAGEQLDAIATFRKLLSDFPESDWKEEAQYNLGYLYFLNQNYTQAISAYESLIKNYPRDPLAAKSQYGIGDALFNAERLDEAVAAYEKVLREYPDSPFAADAAAGIQVALDALDDPTRASSIIDEFTAANPSSPVADELRFRQAEVKYQTGRTDEALADFQRFVRESENIKLLPDAYYYIGTILTERSKPAEAESFLQQIVNRYPDSKRRPEATLKLGQIYLDQGRNQDALDLFKNLETMSGATPALMAQARYGQAKALMNLGRLGEAERQLTELTSTNSNRIQMGPALLGLARVYEASGRPMEAIQLYRQVTSDSPDETGAEALYRLGDLLTRQGQARAAIEELGRMPVLFSGYSNWMAEGYLAQARAFMAIGQRGDAAQMYDRVLEEFRGTIYADRAAKEKASL
ncbi:MAG: tetratricopeptide repeat protein [Rhodothermales bacterium]